MYPRSSACRVYSNRDQSPLSKESHGAEDEEEQRSNAQLAAAGCTLWALQLVWSTIFARGTSHLTHIGIPISLSAILWISGPLSGMLVQPLLGALSDSFHGQSNKRRPFILVGAIATAVSMTGLAWIPNIAVALGMVFGQEHETALLVVNAAFWVCALSISVQPLQVSIRTLLYEITSKSAQARVAAWQGVLIAFGTVCGYFLASVPIGYQAGPWAEIWRFQNLSVVVSSILLLCSVVTLLCPYPSSGKVAEPEQLYSLSFRDALKRNLDCLRSLPRSIQLTLQVQFFSWLGWFPALYYQTAYLASLYKAAPRSAKAGSVDTAEQAALDSMPFTLVMLITATILALASQWSDSQWKYARLGRKITSPETLVDLWLAGHALFAVTLAASLFATTEGEGICIFALIGIPRALSTWAPFALIGREVTVSQHAGTLTGLHNAALSAPQILAAFICAILFIVVSCVENGGRDQARWAMLVASVAACAASWSNWNLRQELRKRRF